jgi:4-hydroxy-tetrahydrodipicolinate reductase
VTRVLLVGAAGRMGGHLLRAISAHPTLELVAALDRPDHPELGKEIAPGVALGGDLRAAAAGCDVAIDFSIPASALALAREAEARGLGLVIGTTGFTLAERERLARAARAAPLVLAPNFSLGVNVLLELVAEAARRLPDYEIEVLELHHSRKVDAPSGTALRLGEAAAEARGRRLAELAVYHREGETGARHPAAIGLQALRAGDSVGEHTVFLAGPGERLELTHRALSRDNFAAGAVRAAAWVHGRPPGLYSMREVLSR